MTTVAGVVAVVLVGLLVGTEFAVAVFMNPIFDRLPGDAGLAARSDGARLLGRAMPFWYIGSVVLCAVWAVVAASSARWLVAGGVGLLAASVVLSVTLLVPINSRVATWSAGTAPTDWREQVGRWDRLHHLRVGILVAALVLLTVAATR